MSNSADVNNPRNIEGTFRNSSIDSITSGGFNFFWTHLSPFDEGNAKQYKDAFINIKILNKHKIQFSLISNKVVVESKTFPYEISEGELVCYGNEKWKGIPVLFYKYQEEDLILNLDKNNNLVLQCDGRRSAGILILAHGIGLHESYVYSKVE
jgi:hypothetical protein